jgi:hypothetical protein
LSTYLAPEKVVFASVMELVDMRDLKSLGLSRAGASPVRSICLLNKNNEHKKEN